MNVASGILLFSTTPSDPSALHLLEKAAAVVGTAASPRVVREIQRLA